MTAVVYAVGVHRFQVTAADDGHGMFQAEARRIEGEGATGRVVFPNGAAFIAKGPTPWEACFRLVTALETYVGARADKVGTFDGPLVDADAIWALPGA